jgi:16S rRNA (cytosine1402-N4)-methyltransferase
MSESAHTPVLLAEVLAALEPGRGRLIVDGTFGAGGYSRAFLERGAEVVAFDRDPVAQAFAVDLERQGGFRLIEGRFGSMAEHLGADAADGVALDLGVSSMQLDEPVRGFSLMRDGPLDMRMGGEGPTAAEIVNSRPAGELARMFRTFGEERQAGRIAGAIERRRRERPFDRTLDLAEAVERALGGRRGAKVHPATRVFQALRIAVNAELEELEKGLAAAEQVLRAGGRLAVVSFHSLEDRIVKTFLAERSGRTPAGSRHAPPLQRGSAPTFELLFNGARSPSAAEIAANPRARSAKLRAAVRTEAAAWGLAA